KNGSTVAGQFAVAVGPNIESKVAVSAAIGFSFGGQETEQVEGISGGSLATARTNVTQINVNAHSDSPSGLFDEFFVAYDIPAETAEFSDNRKPVLDLDYASSKTVTLNGHQLMALAQSAGNVDDVLGLTITDPSVIQAVKTFITPADARSILLVDP